MKRLVSEKIDNRKPMSSAPIFKLIKFEDEIKLRKEHKAFKNYKKKRKK